MSIAMSIFSLLGTFIIGFSMLPQTIVTMKTKDTAKLSLPLYFVMGLATLLITIYGVGLCVVPNPKTHPDMVDVIGTGSFGGNHVDAAYKNWVSGFVVPGAAIIFGELLCSVTSFLVAFVKLDNMMKAKKAGMTEADYVEQHYGDIIRAEAAKAAAKRTC